MGKIIILIKFKTYTKKNKGLMELVMSLNFIKNTGGILDGRKSNP